jgi:lipopolysaccharide/colanic/teichoic acid biosynthesis glycosyltransferase
MALIWVIAVTIFGLLGAAISRQMTDEFKSWAPWIVRHVIDRAVSMLPKDQRERFAEEWRSHVNEIPGDIGKLIVALGFLVASSRMAGIPAAAGKRMFDIAFSAAALALFAPLLLLMALLTKLDSPGPILFSQVRIGRGGKRFHIYKFRTMSILRNRALGPRVTRVGAFLRSTSLDELPQLINVLSGDMSLVGPRPPSSDGSSPSVLHKSDLKPGILLGDGSVNSVRNSGQERRYKEELDYLQNRSLILDLKIVARAVWRILRGSR